MTTELIDAPAGEPEGRQVTRAKATEQDILGSIVRIRREWLALAKALYDFHEERMWTTLGHESFEEWLRIAKIEDDLDRTKAFVLIQAYRELIVFRGVVTSQLEGVDLYKITPALPAIQANEVDVDDVLADARECTVREMRAKYGREKLPDAGRPEPTNDPAPQPQEPDGLETVRFSKDDLPRPELFADYRKTATTRAAGPFDPPVEIDTQHGRVTCDEPVYVAIDADGHPYPVAESVFDSTYEKA